MAQVKRNKTQKNRLNQNKSKHLIFDKKQAKEHKPKM